MQGAIKWLFSWLALFTNSGSAKNGRAMLTRSAHFNFNTSSTFSGVLILFDVINGILIFPINFFVTHVNAAGGTDVAIVGIRASCHPMPVFIMLIPAVSSSLAKATTSSCDEPFGIKSIIESRNINRKFFPTSDLIFSAICMGKRILFSYEPPHESSRLLVCSTKN